MYHIIRGDTSLSSDIYKISFYDGYGDRLLDKFSKYTWLTHLKFDYYFNRSLDNLLRHLQNLTYLYLIGIFNQPITYLPPTLTHLRLSDHFNQQLHIIPSTLTHLRINLGKNTIEQMINIGDLYNLQVICLPNTHLHGYKHTNILSYAYYLLVCDILEAYNRCVINRHNLQIKQTPFYDMLL